jgi:hypothetical protein
MWDSTCLVIMTGLVGSGTLVFVISPMPTVPAHDEHLTVVSVVITIFALTAAGFLEVGMVSP